MDFMWEIFLIVLMATMHDGSQRQKKIKKYSSKRFSQVEIQAVLNGYEEAYELCQYNFKLERWNCPKPEEITKTKFPISLTAVYSDANRETSYVYSIVAAGVAHHMIRACQLGKEEKCRCGKNPKNGLGSSLVTCGENIDYSFRRTRKILRNMDYKRVQDRTRKFFNWNNAAAGLQVYKNSMPIECRCHGVSGHCSTKACWLSTPPSLKIPSMRLKDLYNKAVKLNVPITHVRARPARNAVTANDTKLVYINDSPDYCTSNQQLGILGTLNRECDHKEDKNSCTKLCSSCGFRIHSFVRSVKNEKCNCKFHWCCKVTCETCTERKVISKCLPPA